MNLRTLRLLSVLLLLWLLLGLYPETREAFVSVANFSNLTAQVSEIIIIGVGMTLVVLVGGIDLSVGAGLALCGVVAAKLQIDAGRPAWVAIVAALVCGAVMGVWQGVLVSRFRVPPFIATLSGFLAYRGIALVLSDARGLSPMGRDFAWIGGRLPAIWAYVLCGSGAALFVGSLWRREVRRKQHGLLGSPQKKLLAEVILALLATGFLVLIYQDGMPVPVVFAAITAACGAVVLARTRLGRHVLAIGGNQEAARLSGVPVERVLITVYSLCGVLTAVAALVATARQNGVTPGNAGLMRELHVITAVVIGGTSLSGGSGTMLGTVIGALLFGTLANGMNLLGVNANWQLILSGAILLLASLLDSLSTRMR